MNDLLVCAFKTEVCYRKNKMLFASTAINKLKNSDKVLPHFDL